VALGAHPFEVYRALRVVNPSPYMFFLKIGDQSIIGASPEMLVRATGRRIEYRPIAGTRPRGATDTEDVLLGEEMRADEKEVAEHVMLVDLGRNDLGRVADYGSVEVTDLMIVERYSHVMHLVSSIKARLRPGMDRFDDSGDGNNRRVGAHSPGSLCRSGYVSGLFGKPGLVHCDKNDRYEKWQGLLPGRSGDRCGFGTRNRIRRNCEQGPRDAASNRDG